MLAVGGVVIVVVVVVGIARGTSSLVSTVC